MSSRVVKRKQTLFTLKFWRRIFQFCVAVAFIIIPLLNRSRYSYVYGNFLSFHMFGIPLADPLAILQLSIRNLYLTVDNMVGALLPLFAALLLGTVFCSWVCPFGLLSELTHAAAGKKKSEKATTPKGRPMAFRVKFLIFVLGFTGFFFFSTTPVLNQLSMPAWYTRIFQYYFGQDFISFSFVFILVVLAIEYAMNKRIWCRYICPQSVLISLCKNFNTRRLKVVFDSQLCICKPGYERCEKACSLGLHPKSFEGRFELECSNCGDCILVCKKMGKALTFATPQVGLAGKLPDIFSWSSLQRGLKPLGVLVVVVFFGWFGYNWMHSFTPRPVHQGVANDLLGNHVLSWEGSRADFYEFAEDGTLICVGGDWPTNGFKGGRWETVDKKGSFKMIFNPEQPRDYILVTLHEHIGSGVHFVLHKEGGQSDSGSSDEEHILKRYARLNQSHVHTATNMNATSVLTRFLDEVYIQDLLVQDPGKKIKKILTRGDAITTEGMLTNVKFWLNTPQIIVSEGMAPKLPIHTEMTILFHDGHSESAVFTTSSILDRSSEEFEDPWF